MALGELVLVNPLKGENLAEPAQVEKPRKPPQGGKKIWQEQRENLSEEKARKHAEALHAEQKRTAARESQHVKAPKPREVLQPRKLLQPGEEMQPREVLQLRKPLVLEKEMLREDPLPQSVVHPSVVLLAEKPTRESLPEQPREDPPRLRKCCSKKRLENSQKRRLI